jgi:hypothetical protein
MYQRIHFKNVITLIALTILTTLSANISFADPVSYSPFSYPDAMGGSFGPTGVRSAGGEDLYITGSVHPPAPSPTPACLVSSHGLLYKGPLSGEGSWTVLDYPSSTNITVSGTVLYGPDALPPGGCAYCRKLYEV